MRARRARQPLQDAARSPARRGGRPRAAPRRRAPARSTRSGRPVRRTAAAGRGARSRPPARWRASGPARRAGALELARVPTPSKGARGTRRHQQQLGADREPHARARRAGSLTVSTERASCDAPRCQSATAHRQPASLRRPNRHPAIAHAVDGVDAVERRIDRLELAADALDVRGDRAVVDHRCSPRASARRGPSRGPGWRASACTIQNSVSVRSTGLVAPARGHALDVERQRAAHERRPRLDGGRGDRSARRNSAAMRAARCGRLTSLVR